MVSCSAVVIRALFCSALLYSAFSHAQGGRYERLIFDPVPLSSQEDEALSADAAAAQPEGEAAADDAAVDQRSLAPLQAAIGEALATESLYSPVLRERYLDLARLLQRNGQHQEALATLDSAMHIVRVNEGLFTAAQISDLQLMIESIQALGDRTREAELRGYLLYVQQKAYAPGDPRLLAALEDWADWNLLAYLQGISSDPSAVMLRGNPRAEDLIVVRNTRTGDARFIPRRHLLSMSTAQLASSSLDANPYALMPEMVVDDRVNTARDIFTDLLDAATENDSAEHVGIATRKLASTTYALKRQMDHMLGNNEQSFTVSSRRANSRRDMPMINRDYQQAEMAFEEYLDLLRADPETPATELARTWIDLGDFHMAYESFGDAKNAWSAAIALLQEAGHSEEEIHALLNPTPPFAVPGFVIHPYQRALFGIGPDDTLNHQGYIDVSMDITADGAARNTTITAASEDTPQRIRTLLLDHLRVQRYRPLVENDKLSGISGLQTRYYYSY